MQETAESPSVETSSTESPELYAVQLSYPPEEPGTSRFLDQKVCIPKYESLPEGFSMGNSTSDSFVSPVESSAKSEESHQWASESEFNKPNEMALEQFPILGTYEAVEPNGDHTFGDHPALDFSLYDNFTYDSMAENYI